MPQVPPRFTIAATLTIIALAVLGLLIKGPTTINNIGAGGAGGNASAWFGGQSYAGKGGRGGEFGQGGKGPTQLRPARIRLRSPEMVATLSRLTGRHVAVASTMKF